ncbi:nucleoporin Nup43 [Agrilus planipennis]|uniref:Nucleoporin Nup43 n=1 Tax=Agrilus planipennis TaxID=224129 RepID=A0A1W4WN21_AGRPL|nr:nucleoporin Nup43 [Agrilus planipennis]
MSHSVNTTFISDKTSKIRWKTDPFNDSNVFITGSWDDENNNLKLWEFQENKDDTDTYPFILKSCAFQGDVTELQFVDLDSFVVSSSYGSVYLMRITSNEKELIDIEACINWNKIHNFSENEVAPCTSLSCYKNDIVTCGEDGRINLLTSQHQNIVYSNNNADSCCINCVTFLKFNEVLTGNNRGLLKIWDFRQNQSSLCNSFILGQDQIAVTCVAVHPSQQHILVTGDEEGSITVWDLRKNTFPVNLLTVHTESISEIMFHPDHPDHLFSCSTAGEIWHWLSSSPATNTHTKLLNLQETDHNPWYISDNVKNKLEVFNLMPKLHFPINSLDLSRDRVLCGCDNEAIYLISNVNIN